MTSERTQTASSSQAPIAIAVLAEINQLWVVATLGAVAQFNFASIIGDGEVTTQQLALELKLQERWVYRTLRALSTRGYFVLVEGEPPAVRNTPKSALLRDDHPQSMRAMAQMILGQRGIQQWSYLPETMQTGQPASEIVLGMPTYRYFDQHPEESAIFDQAMGNFAATVNTAIVEAFDFSAYPHIVDIGGGSGSLLEQIHQRYPDVSKTLFERSAVIEKIQSTSHPFAMMEGDFFKQLPVADLYLLKEVFHNWSDPECVKILQTCRWTKPDAAILISEQVIGVGHNFAEWLDLLMGLEQNGCERTRQEYEALFEQAGYQVSQVIPTRSTHTLLLAEAQS
jgi:hypothetical protein